MLESFLFEEPALLAQLKDIVQHESLEHVRLAFRLVGVGRHGSRSPKAKTRSPQSIRGEFGSE
ncbi:MAG TPA: hypothetical protein VFX59_29685 [Polyangiales bacterium]|nr:hypothetical protein [Polyangiales bacterium]